MTIAEGVPEDAKNIYCDLWLMREGKQDRAGGRVKQARDGIVQASKAQHDERIPVAARSESNSREQVSADRPSGNRVFVLPIVLVAAGVFGPAAIFGLLLTQITFFVIPPIGALPKGSTVVTLRMSSDRLFESPDAMCKRRAGNVTLLCRAAAMASVLKDAEIVTRLPYSETFYEFSFKN
jgi:hypothetical protein